MLTPWQVRNTCSEDPVVLWSTKTDARTPLPGKSLAKVIHELPSDDCSNWAWLQLDYWFLGSGRVRCTIRVMLDEMETIFLSLLVPSQGLGTNYQQPQKQIMW